MSETTTRTRALGAYEVQTAAIKAFEAVRADGSTWAQTPDDIRPALCAAIAVIRQEMAAHLAVSDRVFGDTKTPEHLLGRVDGFLYALTQPYEVMDANGTAKGSAS